jgi:hypothetical protein
MGLQNLFGKKKEEETTMPPAEKTQVDPAATNQAVV